jgi:hypothetical protein
MQSVPINTKVVSSNPAHGEVYSIQYYLIKFVTDLRQAGGFLRVFRFPRTIKLPPRYNRNVVESGVKHHRPTDQPITLYKAGRWFSPVSSTNKTDRHDRYNWNIVESDIKHYNPPPLYLHRRV